MKGLLEKHVEIVHGSMKIFCYYFNNDYNSPYNDQCIFVHDDSPVCVVENVKASENANDKMKEKQLVTLKHKVESLQKAGFHQENYKVPTGYSEGHESQRVKSFKCIKCDFASESKLQLKMHLREKYHKKIQCGLCTTKFVSNIELEIHMKTMPISYNCDKCDQEFYPKWRLRKHR